MKILTLLTLAILSLSAAQGAETAPAAPTRTQAELDKQADRIVANIDKQNAAMAADARAIADLTKQLEAAHGQINTLLAEKQQQAVVTEYYKNLAERNEALLRNALLTGQLEAATKEIADLKAKAAVPAKETPAK